MFSSCLYRKKMPVAHTACIQAERQYGPTFMSFYKSDCGVKVSSIINGQCSADSSSDIYSETDTGIVIFY